MTDKKKPADKAEKEGKVKDLKIKDLTPEKDPSGGKRDPRYP